MKYLLYQINDHLLVSLIHNGRWLFRKCKTLCTHTFSELTLLCSGSQRVRYPSQQSGSEECAPWKGLWFIIGPIQMNKNQTTMDAHTHRRIFTSHFRKNLYHIPVKVGDIESDWAMFHASYCWGSCLELWQLFFCLDPFKGVTTVKHLPSYNSVFYKQMLNIVPIQRKYGV